MDLGLATDTTLLALDWRQTQIISESCHEGGNLREANPLFGNCPSMSVVNRNMAMNLGVLFGLANTLHGKYRTAFLSVYGVVEADAVYKGFKIGIRY